MMVSSAWHASSVMKLSTENLRRPNCPRCGTILPVAEQSRFNLRARIDHVWSCDECGNEFITSIRLGSLTDAAAG